MLRIKITNKDSIFLPPQRSTVLKKRFQINILVYKYYFTFVKRIFIILFVCKTCKLCNITVIFAYTCTQFNVDYTVLDMQYKYITLQSLYNLYWEQSLPIIFYCKLYSMAIVTLLMHCSPNQVLLKGKSGYFMKHPSPPQKSLSEIKKIHKIATKI